VPTNDDLIVGSDKADDAGVFRLDRDTALVLTVDFFTPIVDDPYTFGAIAAANALSDVYAMGGRPIAALNVCCFPPKEDKDLLREILRGAADKVAEAGAVIAGGHSMRDDELKYGLAVTGLVHPDRVTTNAGARPGDKLVLTKPIGTGLLSTARRKDAISEDDFEPAVRAMLDLNRAASDAMKESEVNACTDVTGFGLLGHAREMACASGAALAVDYHQVPLFPQAMVCAQKGLVPGGTRNNRAHFCEFINGDVPEVWWAVLFDPQTSRRPR
jgi:selenide,water dikinase